jgi:hypothetical protein
MAESHAPLQMNQFFVYLRDHLLIDKKCRYHIIKSFLPANQCQHRDIAENVAKRLRNSSAAPAVAS